MWDKYIHFSRLMWEKIFIVLTHSEECKNLKVWEIHNLCDRLLWIIPYHQVLSWNLTNFDDKTANNCINNWWKVIINAINLELNK